VSHQDLDFDPYQHDPEQWGVSMGQLTEILLPCLDAAQARSVLEVGAFAGDLTRILVAWAARAGARVSAVDPAPQPDLEKLAAEQPQLDLVRQTSLQALPHLPLPDAIVIDGDHNHHTVSRELALIGERAPGAELPLLLFHDVGWPHGRRDDYFDPEQIPPEARHPTVGAAGGISPGNPGVDPRGLPYPRSADREGGPANGVLTAIEDFVAQREQVRLVVVPVFFGLGVAWHTARPYATALAALLDPLDRHPVLDRLEANRLGQLARRHRLQIEVWELEQQLTRQRVLLQRLLSSSAFALAERLSRLRSAVGIAPGATTVSRAAIRAALDDGAVPPSGTERLRS
jgi:SAM-dependent methyltransferase